MANNKNGGGIAAKQGAVTNDSRTGLFTQTDVLTDKQEEFVKQYFANGGNATKAALDAGYAYPPQDAWRLMRNQAVKNAINQAVGERVATGSVIAWGVLEEIMQDREAPPAVRLGAAKWTLEASGHGLAAEAVRAKLGGSDSKSLSEMSLEEMEEFVKREQMALDELKRAAEAGPAIEVSATLQERSESDSSD